MSSNKVNFGKQENVILRLLEKQPQLTADNEIIYYYTAYMQYIGKEEGLKASVSESQYQELQEFIGEEIMVQALSFDVKRRDNGHKVTINKCAIDFNTLKRRR